ncbi:MAG: hypothetical protein NZT92_10675 [Abditibacteriales bacterium]|nr:hypothetical protein [Abditibacteriales bacterium]
MQSTPVARSLTAPHRGTQGVNVALNLEGIRRELRRSPLLYAD